MTTPTHSPIQDQNQRFQATPTHSPIQNQSQRFQGASSSTNSQISQESSSAMEFLSLSKSLNFNLPIKLGKSNFLYWKTQIFPIIQALDLEDYVCGTNLPSNMYVDIEVTNESGEKVIEKQFSK